MFAGNNISEDYLFDLQNILDKKEYSLIVISKSGTTTEPAIAFRILKQHCEKKYGKEEAKKRIVAITDRQRGALKQLATQEGYNTFVIPDNVGGRYSVLTPVGLLPIAAAGYDIDALLEGAHRMHELLLADKSLEGNPALHYAVMRNLLYFLILFVQVNGAQILQKRRHVFCQEYTEQSVICEIVLFNRLTFNKF